MYAVREMYETPEVETAPERYPAREMYGTRKIDTGQEIYTERGVQHRLPVLVREAAREWMPEEEAIESGGAPSPLGGAPNTDGASNTGGAPNNGEPLDHAESLDHPEPLTDPEDELFLLGERCAEAYMQADALHYQAMRLLAEFDRRSGWQDTGFSSTAEWLAWRIGIRAGSARERVRTALALESLPLTSEAMRGGELSFTKVRALTRVATPENETTLLNFARAGSAANLERVVRGWKTLDRKSEVTAEQIRHRSRRFSAFVDDDGMVVVRGRLDPEVGALLMRAVEAASDVLFREEARTSEEAGPELEETKPEQRRADAVGLLAERALAAGFGNGEGSAPISGTRAERYQVMLHVDADTLNEAGEPGLSELEDGTRVSAETSRRIACDASVVKIAHVSAETSQWPLGSAETSRRVACDAGVVKIARGPHGQVVGAGRRTRTVPPTVRRALEARDRGCRFPGCGLRFTEAHHVKHWADGGESDLRNTVLLCRKHHRAVHEGGVQVCLDVKGQVVFFTPRGKALLGAPPLAPKPLAQGPLAEGHESGKPASDGPGTEGQTDRKPMLRSPIAGAPRWKRDRDIPWEVEAQAWEALDSG